MTAAGPTAALPATPAASAVLAPTTGAKAEKSPHRSAAAQLDEEQRLCDALDPLMPYADEWLKAFAPFRKRCRPGSAVGERSRDAYSSLPALVYQPSVDPRFLGSVRILLVLLAHQPCARPQ